MEIGTKSWETKERVKERDSEWRYNKKRECERERKRVRDTRTLREIEERKRNLRV
jgi:hypothetical protein